MPGGISKDVIEEIRSRCDVVELIGSYLPLKRSGGHTFKGLCPFHNEKTPSFHVDSERQMFHCFGCGKGGDVFRFIMDKENVAFPDALRMLAARTGVVIPETGDRGESQEDRKRRTDRRERLYAINALFADFFHKTLIANPASAAYKYLEKRGIPLDVATKFGIGAVPDEWTACLDYGRAHGFTDEELVESGVIRRKEETGRCFDHFKGRLAFSITDPEGRVVGFSARSLEPKPLAGGKYINTPETPIFKKGSLLYAMHLARRAMGEMNMAILCEGQLDTIAFHRAGFPCAAAPQGTAFTENQARMVKRCTDKVLLAFDADGAGRKAVLRAVEILLPLSVEIRVIRIPGGKDPDELFTHGGAEAVKAAVEAAEPWLNVLCDSLPEKFDMASPSGRAHAAALAADYLIMVESRVELEMYVRMAAANLSVSEAALWMELKNAEKRRRRGEAFNPEAADQAAAIPDETPAADPALVTLFGLTLTGEDAARRIAEAVPPEEIPTQDPVAQAINIVINAALNGEFDSINSELAELLRNHEIPEISRTLLAPPKYNPEDLARVIDETAFELHRRTGRKKLELLTAALRKAATSEEKFKLLAEIQKINAPVHSGEDK